MSGRGIMPSAHISRLAPSGRGAIRRAGWLPRGRRIGCRAPVDLLEYQGKQLFAKHGVPVPDGRYADSVPAAVEAAEEVGYPCVVKAQVRIGKRGKAGGIKIANDRDEALKHAEAILGMDIRGFTVHEVWIERASRIDAEYYASIILDRSEKKLLAMLSRMGGMDVEEVAETDPSALIRRHVEPGEELTARACAADVDRRPNRRGRDRSGGESPGQAAPGRARRGRDPDRGQPADRHLRPRGRRARLEGDDRQQRPVQARGAGRAARPLRRGSPGADGEGEGPHLREARRQRRHPRQRRRPLHVDARRRRPGGRQARQLPRRRAAAPRRRRSSTRSR